ncbi:UNVERIFIED_CONTAM: hypothetical protein Slati_0829800 [Sesamum latifolium]|uniref:Reverse transcriptase domain-containing protein n=1 Tax=Sesamum latifolium TaxID=2727402 RepID=A0AAW2XQ77_9LAMI
MEENQEFTNPDQVKKIAATYFKNLLSCNLVRKNIPDFPFQFPQVLEETNRNICNLPTDKEIKYTVFSIDMDSVAVPDGCSSAIYHACWEFITTDINEAVKDFFCGRLNGDNFLIAQEIIHHLDLRYNKGNLVINLDTSKAYDRVNWNFLIAVMQKMGFPPRFLTLIKHAIQNCWFTILVNGEAAGSYKSSKGLRQADPISPALFILAAEAFSRGLDFLFNVNPKIFCQTKCEVKISHLSYADDVIFFTNCEEASLIKLMKVLRNFKEISGPKINHAKSAFIPGKKANLIARRIKSITGFSMKALPITYLEAPFYKSNKKKMLYKNLIDKVRAKISRWEHYHLSYGGRLQLIKTVLSWQHNRAKENPLD